MLLASANGYEENREAVYPQWEQPFFILVWKHSSQIIGSSACIVAKHPQEQYALTVDIAWTIANVASSSSPAQMSRSSPATRT